MNRLILLVLLLAGAVFAQDDRWAAEATEARAAHEKDKEALAALAEPKAQVDLALVRLAAEKRRLSERLDARAAVSERAGDLLMSALRRFRTTRGRLDTHTLPQLDSQLARVQAERVGVQDRIWELELPLDGSEPLPKDMTARAYGAATRPLLDALRERVATLEKTEVALAEIEAKVREQRAALTGLIALVLGKSYWLRTDPALGGETARRAADEAQQLYRVLRDATWSKLRTAKTAFAAALLGIALFLRLRLRRSGQRWAYRGGPMWQGAQRTGVAVLLAAVPPLAVLGAALLTPIQPVSVLLQWTAGLWFLRALLRRVLRPQGIAEVEWGMAQDCAAELLRSAKIGTTAALLFFGPSEALRELPLGFTQLPRLLYMGYLAGVALAVVLAFRSGGAIIAAWTRRQGFFYRARVVWFIVALLFATVVLTMHALGYRLGARMRVNNMLKTVLAAAVLTGAYRLLHALVDRLASRVRRRALETASGREAAREQSTAVTEQLTRVVTVSILVAALFALVRFWDIGAGISAALDAVSLYSGAAATVTLWDLARAIFWIAAGHFIVANLAGLYEFLVFPLIGEEEVGGRFVILAFARYAVLVFAYSAAVLALHFSFTSLGFVLAAMSVGLGFGLQEIVANFVSGIILLLERPVRVGDIISVGDTGGIVDRITIRATIVTNWDRQVIIVPNKRFITENVTNWTRNDAVMRRKVAVGVRYGSDVEKVLRILTEIVTAHELVAKEPQPRVWFDNFGDSSLNFEIWFFCEVQRGREVMSAIHTEIHRRFAEEGIEIPFPQRDLHVRSVDDEAFAALLEKRRSDEEARS